MRASLSQAELLGMADSQLDGMDGAGAGPLHFIDGILD